MAKAKVNIKINAPRFKALSDPKKIHNKIVGDQVGKSVKKKVLDLVASGISPVKGKGRFKAYAAQRSGAISKYPNIPSVKRKYPSKKTRPVNLKLDGSYLEAISKFINLASGIRFGLIDGSKFMKALFEAHNEGKNKDIPQRKVIPTKGEGFVVAVDKIIKDIYLKRIRNIIRFGR